MADSAITIVPSLVGIGGAVSVKAAPYNAFGDGVHDDTAAIQAAVIASPGVFIPDGTYLISAGIALGFKDQHIYGESVHGTVILPTGAGVHGFTEPTVVTESRCVIENMTIGNGTAGTGSGLYFPTKLTYLSTFRNLQINMGSDAVALLNEFSTTLDNIFASSVAGHAFNVSGGSTTTLINCYAGTVGTAGKYGFRSPAGGVFISCNGVNSGSNWGRFGSTVALDGVNVQFDVSLIRCNFEAFTDIGVDLVNEGSCRIEGGAFNISPGATYTTCIELETSTGELRVTGTKFFTAGGIRTKLSDIWTAAVNYPVLLSEDVAAAGGVPNIDGNGTLYPAAFTYAKRGQWTPVLAGTSTAGTNTYTLNAGNYTVQGRLVVAEFLIQLSGNSVAMVGNLKITGLPFAANASLSAGGLSVIRADFITFTAGYTQLGGTITQGATEIILQQIGTGAAAIPIPEANIGATTGIIRGIISYFM